MSAESTLERNPDVVFRPIEGGGVLLNTKSGSYHEVNSTASEIWRALETPATETDVIRRLAEQFGDEPELDADIREFLSQLAARELIVISDR